MEMLFFFFFFFFGVVFLKSQCGGLANISGLLAVISELLELGSEIWYRK